MLTKSDLQSLLQCPRKLWLETHHPEYVPKGDPTLYRRAVDGNFVGAKAREQLGDVIPIPNSAGDKAAAAENAKKVLGLAKKPAAEVPMVYAGLYARADALIPEHGKYILRETKASTFPLKTDKATPGNPKEHHVSDLAIQLWTAEGMGFPVARAELNLLDNKWRYPGGGNYEGLFRQIDVSEQANVLKPQVPTWLEQASNVVAGKMPEIATGKQCSDPYPCPFLNHCEKLDPPGPEHPIELLPDSAGKRLAAKLRETRGYTSLLDPKPEELSGKDVELYRRIQKAHRAGTGILELGSDTVLQALPYPRYFFDFEGIDLPVPKWKGLRPYEQVPFQWSCHIERSPGVFEHAEFLDLSGDDPSLKCIDRMREVIDPGDAGPIVVYYSTYERQRLAELAIRHPEHEDLLNKYIERLCDLHPLVKRFFYHPEMRGSFSIKKVLPVIAPEMKYEELEGVQEGTGAQVAYLFATMDSSTSEVRKTEIDAELRKYCRQDTWAMVEVAYFLAKQKRPTRPKGM
jgi:hypothetical protein